MINVSFNELAATSELPAPRSNPRPVDVSAFSKMLDNADTRAEAPANNDSRDSRLDTRAEPATERASAADVQRQDNTAPRDVSVQEDMSKRPPVVADSDNRDSSTRPSSDDNPKNIPQKADEADSAEAPLNDDKQQADTTPAAVPFVLPPVILADATPTLGLAETAPLVAPIAGDDMAVSPQDDGTVFPQPVSALRAPQANAPTTLPGAAPSDETDRSKAASPSTTEPTAPAIAAAVAGKVMSETLFAVTTLLQEVTPEPEVVTLPVVATQTAPLNAPQPGLRKAQLTTAIAAQPTEPSAPETEAPLAVAPQDVPVARSDAMTLAPKAAANPTPAQQVKDLTALLALNGDEVTVSSSPALSQTNPVPALANGMVSQIGAALSGEGKAKSVDAADPSTMAISDTTTTPNASLTQTAMAVAGAVMPQAVQDEPQPKLTATADGLVINAPGPASSSHASYASAVESANGHKSQTATPAVVDQVAVHVAKAAADGIDKINIKLKPVSLGQIDVQLEIASDGRIHAVIAADKPETLDLLQRDARALERALGDAGLRTDSSSLSFNLRGQNQQFAGSGNNFAGFTGGLTDSAASDSMTIGDVGHIGAYLNSRAAAGGVDISV